MSKKPINPLKTPLRTILVAPDSFKGSIGSAAVCDAIEQGILKEIPQATIIKVPLADGGEGTVDALVFNSGGRFLTEKVTDPLGNKITARYGIMGDKTTAVIEMAEASGLMLIPKQKRNPAITTTRGTGELIKAAINQGCERIILGLGGSATNDYGVGALQALGFSFKDSQNLEIGFGCHELMRVETVETSGKLSALNHVEFVIASDVDNPLLGKQGATHVYARQKGAIKKDLPQLEDALAHINTIVEQARGQSVQEIPGAGAAGGFGAGVLAFLHGEIVSGANLIMDIIGFKQLFETNTIDLVITGEGSIDSQTVHGKLPVRVAEIAKRLSVPVIAIVGSKGDGFEAVFESGIDAVYSLCDGDISREESIANPVKSLVQTSKKMIHSIQTKEPKQ